MHSDGNQGSGCQGLCCLIVPFRNEQRTVPRAKLDTGQKQKDENREGILSKKLHQGWTMHCTPRNKCRMGICYETVNVQTEWWLPVVSNGESGILPFFFLLVNFSAFFKIQNIWSPLLKLSHFPQSWFSLGSWGSLCICHHYSMYTIIFCFLFIDPTLSPQATSVLWSQRQSY